MFKSLVTKIFGDPNKKIIKGLQPIVDEVAALESTLNPMNDEALKEQTAVLKERLINGATLEDVLPHAFALVREASRRATGLRHYDVQIMGGVLMHRGDVIEMRTGEGKTLVATLPLFLNALTSQGVHLVTVNEYLARRDGGWMGKIFHSLGLTVGCIGPQQFSALYDPDYVTSAAALEDERLVHWRPCTRQQAYRADVTYGIASEFGFDYLRDNMATNMERLVQRELNYAVIDEVDNILIDEARTPLIISGPASRSGSDYVRFSEYVRRLKPNTADDEEEPNGHYNIDEKSRTITLTEIGIVEIENRIPEINGEAGDNLYDPRFYHLTYYLENALKAQYLFKRDVDYVVQNDEVIIIDGSTGRLMHGRRYSDGLHEAIEAKEGVNVRRETMTVATITLQNYFRLYSKLAGMTGTAMTDAEEFDKIYKLGVTPLPTNVQNVIESGHMGLIEQKVAVENTTAIVYVNPTSKEPVFFKRTDFPDQVYRHETAKDQAIIAEIKRVYQTGRPVLVGTTSVEHSEVIHKLLQKDGVPHTVLNAKIHQSEALVVAQAGRKGAVTISTNMAGRGTDILLGGNPEGLTAVALEEELFDRNLLIQLANRLWSESETAARDLARKHPKLDETLVDALLQIKTGLDTDLAEIKENQIVGYLAKVLQTPYKADYNDIVNVLRLVRVGQLSEARNYLERQDKDIALVDEAVRLLTLYTQYQTVQEDPRQLAQFLAENLFEKHYNARAAVTRAVLAGKKEEAEQIIATIPGLSPRIIERIEQITRQAEIEREEIRKLGGLHVVGSERHESRRIDNQLRGRAARQGDPGSSRFFLSVEDDLMRRFGGERLKSWMSSSLLSSFPEDMPIEHRALDKIIESSQERIEGYNFDIRKNVVEYDDVMSRQRQAIYAERRAILAGEAVDLDAKISEAFANAIEELVKNYVEEYTDFVRGEIQKTIESYSTDATDTINMGGVIARLRGLLPGITILDRAALLELSDEQLTERFMQIARQNEERGYNLYQLLQAMGRFLPFLGAVPNLANLAMQRSNQLQTKERVQHDYMKQVQQFFEEFLANYIEETERGELWQKAEHQLHEAFSQFSLEGLSLKNAATRQEKFKQKSEDAIRTLLFDGLSALDSDQLNEALLGYIQTQQTKWQQLIGDEEYRNFQRLLLLEAIDREWRDYLTAVDDLRREIGLEAFGQKDPKVQYKIRSAEMFADMRNNIEKDIADRFFRQIQGHQAYIRQQQAEVAYQVQAREAGYQVVKREKGKGVELRRDLPKVGRNDPCPCGSGKKYKHCHGQQERGGRASNGEMTAKTTPPVADGKKRR